MNRCEKCDELYFGSKHTCAPSWRVWVHEQHEVGDDADSWEVHARDAEIAAEVALATHNDEGQYVEREGLEAKAPTSDGADEGDDEEAEAC